MSDMTRPYIVVHVSADRSATFLGDAKDEVEAMKILRHYVEETDQFQTGYVTYAKIVIKYEPDA